jgi:cell division protein ZapA (FtsZ GTPase activity inhibitor)
VAEEIKKIYARIGGMSYHLVTSENELYTRQIAAKADEMINRVMQNNPHLSQNMSTVLALVNAVDELNSLYAKQSAVDSQKQEMEKQTGDIRKELMRLREQNWEMKKEILRLNDLCQDYQALITKLTTPGEPVRTDILEDARLAKQAAAPAGEAESTKQPAKPIDQNSEVKSDQLTFDGNDDELSENPYVTGDADLTAQDTTRDDESGDLADPAGDTATKPVSEIATPASHATAPVSEIAHHQPPLLRHTTTQFSILT